MELNPLIFTDLDGTLLDHHTYSYREALPALELLKRQNIPWIFNTSKTFAELVTLQQEMQNPWPMILENGSGVAVPKNMFCEELFGNPLAKQEIQSVERNNYLYYRLGHSRQDFLPLVAKLKADFDFIHYGEMQPEYLANLTGLNLEKAIQSLDRQYTEPCLWQDTEQAFVEFKKRLRERGLYCVRGGRFAHVMGKSDKGRALKWVASKLYSGNQPTKIALGDGENDLPMLNEADIAILVRSPQHEPPSPCQAPQTRITEEIGPLGWSGAIIALLK